MKDDSTNREHTYLRDMELSKKLRENYGYMCDVDSLMCDFNNRQPCGLLEYKHWMIQDPIKILKMPKTVVQKRLADRAGIPFAVCFYKPGVDGNPWQYNVLGMNKAAVKILGSAGAVQMSEQEFHKYHALCRHVSAAKGYPEVADWLHPQLVNYKGGGDE